MVIGCDGVSGSTGTNNIMGIDGANRMYTLSGVEEFTEFMITLTTENGAGSTSVSRMARTGAGNYNILRALLCDWLGENKPKHRKYIFLCSPR